MYQLILECYIITDSSKINIIIDNQIYFLYYHSIFGHKIKYTYLLNFYK